MKIEELVRSARESAPQLKTLADEDAQRLVREVFGRILQEIDATPEGAVRVDALGLFRVRQREREQDGATKPVKRIAFQPHKTGGDKA